MKRFPAAGVLLLLMISGAKAQRVEDLLPGKTKLEAVEYKGRKAIRMMVEREGEGLAMLRDTEFGDGTIQADVAVKMTTPPGVRNPGFIGIVFRSRPDARHYELFYIRPGNSHAEDQAMRNHVVQYVESPDFDWYKLRRTWPWVYEAHGDIQPEVWIRMRIQVEGRRAGLFLDGFESRAGGGRAERRGSERRWVCGDRRTRSPISRTYGSPTRNGSRSRMAAMSPVPGNSNTGATWVRSPA